MCLDGLAWVASFRSAELGSMSDGELEEGLRALRQGIEAAETERLRWVAEADRRREGTRRREPPGGTGPEGARHDGHLSTVSFLEARVGMAAGEAAREVRVARALERMPRTREALGDGEISPRAARALARARETHPEAFSRDEKLLVDAATRLPERGLRQALASWGTTVDLEAAREEARRMRERRRLDLSPTPGGMVRVEGSLDPETGELVLTAVGAVMDAEARSAPPDGRTAAQRRADALGEVCRGWLDSAARPRVAGERPHVTVLVDLRALGGDPGRTELSHAGAVIPDVARLISCDASVRRVVLGGSSEPLDVGRQTKIVPAALRRAVEVRDRGCRFPGCGAPVPWCDAHHVRHWADGGPTALGNLVLLCRRHHRAMHEGLFRVEMAGGVPAFLRPDGSPLEDRAPPLVGVE